VAWLVARNYATVMIVTISFGHGVLFLGMGIATSALTVTGGAALLHQGWPLMTRGGKAEQSEPTTKPISPTNWESLSALPLRLGPTGRFASALWPSSALCMGSQKIRTTPLRPSAFRHSPRHSCLSRVPAGEGEAASASARAVAGRHPDREVSPTRFNWPGEFQF
jgi:hypothetical protein